MITNKLLKTALCLCFIAVVGEVSFAQEWPGWRGSNRDGAVLSFSAPKAWPDQLKVKWKMPVGIGHSSPVVAGRAVYVFSRQDEQEVVSAIDLDSGKLLWKDSYATPYTMNPAAASHGKGPKSTPVLQGGKLYTLGISGILSCYDTRTGKLAWRKEFSKQFKATSPFYGTAMSPIVDNGLLIAHVGGHDAGALMAFNAETGELKWSWKGDGPGYASPIAVELNGLRQIVTQTQKFIVGISASNGELIWQIPFETEYSQNSVTPVAYKNTLIFSGIDKGTMAVKIIKRDGKWTTEQVWQNSQVSMYMNSPVINGDYLFGLSHKRKGQFFCLDARTGETLWTSEGREGENAAMLSAGETLFLLTNDAELIVAKNNAKRFETLKKYTVAASPTWAHPAIIGNRILIKDASTLALLSVE
ncbi:MAG TPA: PQQ-binding-like beta-propeller repeat protein [Blastocatellia bacterium]|nr:PQQ-binding-like beta-propeller repeat protein [Blastocatellia bacterium]